MIRTFCLCFVCFCFTLVNGEPLQTISVRWEENCFRHFQGAPSAECSRISGVSIYFASPHIDCYGHALLDGVFPLYCMLKKQQLLDAPITLLLHLTPYEEKHPTVLNILQLLRDVFSFKDIVILRSGDVIENLILNESVPLDGSSWSYSSFYREYPESFKYIDQLKCFGIEENIVFVDRENHTNLVREFAEFIKKSYKIDQSLIKNRILIGCRLFNRRILNLDNLVKSLRNVGYTVVVVDFESLSIRQQIIETVQSEYIMGTYGSNLMNAMFLEPGASVIVLWHKYAKYFWSRRYCILHSAFLSAGVRLIEYDKPKYDPRDVYPNISVHEYFYRIGSMNKLKKNKITLESMTSFPFPAMYEITNVDLYIDPDDFLNCLAKARSMN